jgi:hypothetical protein
VKQDFTKEIKKEDKAIDDAPKKEGSLAAVKKKEA